MLIREIYVKKYVSAYSAFLGADVRQSKGGTTRKKVCKKRVSLLSMWQCNKHFEKLQETIYLFDTSLKRFIRISRGSTVVEAGLKNAGVENGLVSIHVVCAVEWSRREKLSNVTKVWAKLPRILESLLLTVSNLPIGKVSNAFV